MTQSFLGYDSPFSHHFTEDNVKKAHFSPVASLFMSLSLALGILVGNLSGYSPLTSVHAQEGGCDGTVTGSTVKISDGVVNGGITVRDVIINGEYVAEAMIVGNIRLVAGEASQASGALVGGGAPTSPSLTGALVGGGAPTSGNATAGTPCSGDVVVGLSGALVGGGAPVSNADGNITVGGAVVSATGTFVGGMLTGDNISIVDGVITGQNLMLSGATIDGGTLSGTVTSVSVTPAN